MSQITLVKANGYREGQPVTDKEYKLLNGTYFDGRTPDAVCKVLSDLIGTNRVVRIFWGDTATGKCWNDEHDIIGRIGRSTGTVKIPLIVNVRSMGGPGLLDHCLLKIRDQKTGLVLYQADNWTPSKIEIVPATIPGYTHSVIIDGELYSNHKTERSAKLLKTKLS